MQRALVLGYGESGRAAERFLEHQGWAVVIADQKSDERVFADDDLRALEGVELVIVSPGVAPTQCLYAEAVVRGLPVIGEIELGLRVLKHRAVGITGTNGKTTVTLMVAHALNRCGLRAVAVGNVGVPLTQALLSEPEETILVVELSSWQLETVGQEALEAAILLNITPDHLDRHITMEHYAAAKARIQYALKPNGRLYLHEEVAREFGEHFQRPYATYRAKGDEASHDEANAWAAYSLCQTFGVGEKEFFAAIQDFRKPPHRMEFVRSIEGVDYIDDSKGTNVDAVLKAVQSLKGPILLIAGGVDKRGGYEVWQKSFPGCVKGIFAIGEAAEAIQACLGSELPVRRCANLQEAVVFAREAAIEGDTVLLSPGCASYDMFKNYKHRGESFQSLVHQLCEGKEGLL